MSVRMDINDEWVCAYVMSGVGVVINASEEGGGGVLADVFGEEVTAAGVFVHEGGDVVDEAGDEDEWAFEGLFLDW